MPRLLFEKTGNAVWISHLDLMRVFQRSFKRAGLPLTHTRGFNPRPSVSIALPLSVGIESRCELLDFDLDGDTIPNDEICARLNASLIDGVRVLSVYDDGRKIKNLAYLDCRLRLEYDGGISRDGLSQIQSLFAREELPVTRKNKNGVSEQNIIPMIRRLEVQPMDDHTLVITARICCQNPSLNPMQLHVAIAQYLPELTADYVACSRLELYDETETIFR